MDVEFYIYQWDDKKYEANRKHHKVDFKDAVHFEWESALEADDTRQDYGESRKIALGFINRRLYVMVYTYRGEFIRLISLRKANNREINRYEHDQA